MVIQQGNDRIFELKAENLMMQYLPMMSIYYPLQGGNESDLRLPKAGNIYPGTNLKQILKKAFKLASASNYVSPATRIFSGMEKQVEA